MNELNGSILAVDDCSDNLLLLEHLFKPFSKLSFYQVKSGTEALELLKSVPIDVILLDVDMPIMDGYTVAKEIKANPATTQIPIIFITGERSAKSFVEKGFAVGAVDYMVKPLDHHLLINRVRLYLQLTHKEKQLQKYSTDLESLVEQRTSDLRQAIEEKDHANRFKTEFYANMSHELRTPLHAILALSKRGMTNPDYSNAEKIQSYFTHIHKSGEQMLDLINNLLDLNKLEHTEQKFVFSKFNLHFLTENILNEFKALFEEHSMQYSFESEIQDLEIDMDKKQIASVIRNLIDNAIRYKGDGHFISILLKEENDKVLWSISDTGVGIPEEEKESIFEAFQQSSRTKNKAGGTGLGLSICQKIIGAHNGSIYAQNLEKGAQFVFTLPIHQIIPNS